MKPKVYIAGWTGEVEYRAYVWRKYRKFIDIFDPLKEVESKLVDDIVKKATEKQIFDSETITKIVEGDKAAILSCHLMTVIINKYTAGTMMEMLYAWEHQIPIFLIDPTKQFRNDIWIKYHTTRVFNNVDSCYDYIIDSLG